MGRHAKERRHGERESAAVRIGLAVRVRDDSCGRDLRIAERQGRLGPLGASMTVANAGLALRRHGIAMNVRLQPVAPCAATRTPGSRRWRRRTRGLPEPGGLLRLPGCGGLRHLDWERHLAAANATVAPRDLVQVLLVVILRVIEGTRRRDLRRDRIEAGRTQR